MNIPQEIFVLLADADGTMHSQDEPFGVAVTTEAEAKRFVSEGKFGYSHSYRKLSIFTNKDEAIKHHLDNFEKMLYEEFNITPPQK